MPVEVQIPETYDTLAAFEALDYDVDVRVKFLKAKIGSLDGDCQGAKQALYDRLLALLKQEAIDAGDAEDKGVVDHGGEEWGGGGSCEARPRAPVRTHAWGSANLSHACMQAGDHLHTLTVDL